MEAIKLSKKFKDICYEIMDGSSESVLKLDAFSDEFMHQVMAVKAAVAFFDIQVPKRRKIFNKN